MSHTVTSATSFLREVMLWLACYPASVAAAAVVVMLPFMISDPDVFAHSHMGLGSEGAQDPLLFGAMKVIGVFCLLPAIIVRIRERHARGRIWPYVSGGAWTGFCGGLLLMFMPLIIGTAVLPQLLVKVFNGSLPPAELVPLADLVLFSAFTMALSFLAGAVGGLVLGAAARKLDTSS